MGEIADMMIEGDLCGGCGVYMEGGAGFMQFCSACRREGYGDETKTKTKSKRTCCTCKKLLPKKDMRFLSNGLKWVCKDCDEI